MRMQAPSNLLPPLPSLLPMPPAKHDEDFKVQDLEDYEDDE